MNENRTYRFILSGGGTGGHLFPAIAIANALQSRFPGCRILFVGAKGKMEMEKVPQAGYEIIGLNIGGIQRSNILKNVLLPCKIVGSILKCLGILWKMKPDVVIGTGGYASFPLVFTAVLRRIPAVIQEQNFFPGITNKFLSKWVKSVCVPGDGLEKYFPVNKIVVTGNPVRNDIILSEEAKIRFCKENGLNPAKKTIFITGGSLGARTLNESVLNDLELLEKNNIQVIWQTGNYYFNEIKNQLSDNEINGVRPFSFIKDMAGAYSSADLVIARAGAITLSELAIMGKPVILVPSPNVAEDHQTKNALSFTSKNAAWMIADKDARNMLIFKAIELINSAGELQNLSKNIRELAIPDADKKIADVIEKIMDRK